MKSKFVLLVIVLIWSFSVQAQTKIIIRLENPLNVERAEVVSIAWSDIKGQNPKIDQTKIVVTDLRTMMEVPYQLETKGEAQVQNLLIYTTISASGYREFEINEGKPSNFQSKTFCRYVPERKDDFAWENDRIAYRMYGKALEGTKEDAYGTDVWAKKVDYLIIDKWYKSNDYHNEHGEGHDFYHVGLTLGAGNIAPYENNKIWYPANYHRWKVLDNGPLRSRFQLEYDAWDVAGRQVTVTKTISIDAGSQLNKVEAEFMWNDDKPMLFVAGLIKRKTAGTILLDEQKGIMGYWEPTIDKSGTIGITCLFMQAANMMVADQLMGIVKLEKPGKLTYYNGAAWDRAGLITTASDWFEYLNNSVILFNSPIKVSIKGSK